MEHLILRGILTTGNDYALSTPRSLLDVKQLLGAVNEHAVGNS